MRAGIFFILCCLTMIGRSEGLLIASERHVSFTPPEGWKLVDSKLLSPRIKIMVVGKGSQPFYPPSMNLGFEDYAGSLQDYLKEVKEINQKTGAKWVDLGPIQTLAGKAHLSQVDVETEWGAVRIMHVMFIEDHILYVLSAASLKNEFSSHFPKMLNSLKTLNFFCKEINPGLL